MTSTWPSFTDRRASQDNVLNVKKREVNPYGFQSAISNPLRFQDDASRKPSAKFTDFSRFASGNSQPDTHKFVSSNTTAFFTQDEPLNSSTPIDTKNVKPQVDQQESPSVYINKGLQQFQSFLGRRTLSNQRRHSFIPPSHIPSASTPLYQDVDDTFAQTDAQYFDDDSVYTVEKQVKDVSTAVALKIVQLLLLLSKILWAVVIAAKESTFRSIDTNTDEHPEYEDEAPQQSGIPGTFPRKTSLLSRLVSAASTSTPIASKTAEIEPEDIPRRRLSVFQEGDYSRFSETGDADNSMVVSSFIWNDSKPTKRNSAKRTLYGSKFFTSRVPATNEPDIEADYFKKVFNKDGLFEADLTSYENGKVHQSKTRSISRFMELSKRVRTLLPESPKKHEEEYHGDDWMITAVNKIPEPEVHNFEDEFKAYQSIMEEKRKRQELVKVARMRESAEIRPLDADQVRQVSQYLTSRDDQQVISKNFGVTVRVVDFRKLRSGAWLNDTIMDFYFAMMVDRSRSSSSLPKIFAFTTHFYTTLASRGYTGVARWAKKKKIDVTELDYVFVPVNVGSSHWTLAVINNRKQCFEYYDSLSGSNPSVFRNLAEYMVQESTRIHGKPAADYHSWKGFDMETPQQQNGYDCGVFTCTAGEYLSREMPLTFSQSDMDNLRKRMGYEIITSEFIRSDRTHKM